MAGIRLKLWAALAALVAVVVLAAGVLGERAIRSAELARREASQAAQAAILASESSAAPADPSGSLARRVERAAVASEARVVLLGVDGEPLADSAARDPAAEALSRAVDLPEVRAALAGTVGRAERPGPGGHRWLHVAFPLNGAGPERVVRFSTDLSTIAGSNALHGALALAAALGLGAAFVLARLMSERLVRPLEEIGRFAGAVAGGDLGRRLERSGSGEAGALADAVDRMADELRRRIDEANAEKERLQAVLQGMVEGVLVVNAAGRVMLANPRLREMLSVWGDVIGRSPLEVIRHAGVDDVLRAATSTGDLVAREIQVGGPDGRTIRVHAVGFPASGPRLGTVAVFHDVTDLRRLEAVRRDFVANVSHELKTPLTAIRGFAETLVSGDVPEPDVKTYLGVILKHAERLGNLIEDLLELSRIESRKLPLRSDAIDVAKIAAGIVSGLEPQLRARSLRVEVRDPGVPLAFADRRAVEQVLTNLLDNAAKYTNPGGRIEIRLGSEPDAVRVEVADDGIGIPEEDLPRIFERFYRVDKARSRDLGGTGLGLAIVKHLVQTMGGEISVESEIGHGTVFCFTLPRAGGRAPADAIRA